MIKYTKLHEIFYFSRTIKKYGKSDSFFLALQRMKKNIILPFLILCLGLVTANTLQAAVITHDISSSSLSVAGDSPDDYIIVGSTTTNKVVVNTGYTGTITLRNVSIQSLAATTGTNTYSPFTILGKYNCSNLAPVTKVNLILEGDNELLYTGGGYACLQVDQGAQIHISAIDPNDNASGRLSAKATPYVPGVNYSLAGAGIGAPGGNGSPGVAYINQGTSPITGGCSSPSNTAGGNIIISSGEITAWGGHGAGIGGGFTTYYNGIIIVYGGIVEARGGYDSAGIGSGCPLGTGVLTCYADVSTVVALPPSKITAYGAGKTAAGGVGMIQFPELGLTGTKNITYINDPNKPIITVRTEDDEPNANIYLDLTETPGLVEVFDTLKIDYDLKKVKVGKTEADGKMSFHARFEQNTTFFTDASSSNSSHLGRPYMPVTKKVLVEETVTLPLLGTEIAFVDYPSTPLETGYTSTQAKQNAYCLKMMYDDPRAMTNVTFAIQGGADFLPMIFLESDSSTVTSAPTELNPGDVYFIILPIQQGKPMGIYSDVLLIHGDWQGTPLPGYIRRVGEQRIVHNDTNDNTYIKVTASPNKFEATYPATNTVALTLNITHQGMTIPYKSTDVTAKYLITTEADYDAALAANPINSWPVLNIPAGDNVNTVTNASFSGKAIGTYYIHWYVVSGVVYAHSRTVINPPRQYGGFGPYSIITSLNAGSLSGNQYVCSGQTPSEIIGEASTGGSGNFTYQWQKSTDGTTWNNVGGNTVNYTPDPLTASPTYFRRLTTDNTYGGTTPSDNVFSISIVQSGMVLYWKKNAVDNNWNNPANWEDASGNSVTVVPLSCTDVHIPGNAAKYPSLDPVNSPRAGYGLPTCNDITFHFGAEIARTDSLIYNKAYIQYNFGYYDQQNLIQKGWDTYSATPMARERWYALSAPLKKVVTGDFTLGGFPFTWQRGFMSSRDRSGILNGNWYYPENTIALEIGAKQNYAISLYIADYNPSLQGQDNHSGLNNLHGIFEVPYFENSAVNTHHRIHSYSGGVSKFNYFNREDPSFPLMNDRYDVITRGAESYRFIFEGDNNQPKSTFTIKVPVVDSDGDLQPDEVMIGNPFISSLDFYNLYQGNSGKMEDYYRLYNNGIFETHTATRGDYIAPLQAFFIKPIGVIGSEVELTFAYTTSVTRTGTHQLRSSVDYAPKADDLLTVSVSNNTGESWASICYSEGKDIDQLFCNDSTNMSLPQVYLIGEKGRKNAVQYIGTSSATIPLGIWSIEKLSGQYQLSFGNVDQLGVTSLSLLDKETGTTQDLFVNSTYSFTIGSGFSGNDLADRFLLKAGKQFTSIDDLSDQSFDATIYAVGNTLYVESESGINEIALVNAQGMKVYAENAAGKTTFSKQLNLARGIYIVSARLQNGETKIEKIVIR